jgi:DNA polymerase elongation subunit (family B)
MIYIGSSKPFLIQNNILIWLIFSFQRINNMNLEQILNLLTIGIDEANQALDLTEADQSTNLSYGIEIEAYQLRNLIANSTSSLKEAISIGIDKIIDKIEQDKLEELISRINNIDLLLRIKRHEQLLPYILQLRESVDYAKNRLL